MVAKQGVCRQSTTLKQCLPVPAVHGAANTTHITVEVLHLCFVYNATYGYTPCVLSPTDPSHDTVLHHGLGGLSRSLAGPGKILDYHMDEKGYTISRWDMQQAVYLVLRSTCLSACVMCRLVAAGSCLAEGSQPANTAYTEAAVCRNSSSCELADVPVLHSREPVCSLQ